MRIPAEPHCAPILDVVEESLAGKGIHSKAPVRGSIVAIVHVDPNLEFGKEDVGIYLGELGSPERGQGLRRKASVKRLYLHGHSGAIGIVNGAVNLADEIHKSLNGGRSNRDSKTPRQPKRGGCLVVKHGGALQVP
jgi:hypothetical protein